MKLIENILYIEFADFLTAGWKEDAVKKANFRNGPFWMMIPNPTDRRMPLVQFDTLRPKDKQRLNDHFGDVYEHIAKEPILKLLKNDTAAELFFKDYRYAGGQVLPSEHRFKYATAAAWLNMINDCLTNKKVIKEDLKLSVDKFILAVCDLIRTRGIELPSSSRRLIYNEDSSLKKYKDTGYASLIDWRFGNKLAAKVGKSEDGFDADLYEKQVAFIRKAASMHQNFDAQQITSFVNPVFEKNGWSTLSRATVYKIMQENEHLTTAGSNGKRVYNNSIAMQIKRKAPEFPLYYFTLDGWTAELLYKEGNNFNNRLVVVVVLDAMNKYPIGYAIGDRENTELIRQANRNASEHIKELFGEYYHPKQLQSDRFQLKNLTPFYQAMAHMHTPAAVGNAKSKVIEPYFNYINKKYCQRFPNWSGYNVTSKKSNQPNIEFLDMTKHSFPDRDGVVAQIEMIIAQERRVKIDAYMQQWESCPAHEKVIMSTEDRLMVFGQKHKEKNSITGHGLIVRLLGQKCTYDSFDPAFRELQHQRFQIVYDEADLSNVLAITEDNKRRFVLNATYVVPMDVHSMQLEDYEHLAQVKDYNKMRMQKVVDTYISDNEKVAEIINNTPLALDDYNEAAIKLMFTHNGQQKEALQDAKGLKKVQAQQQRIEVKEAKAEVSSWQKQQAEYLASKNDFNQFLD